MKCLDDVATLKKWIGTKRVYVFLSGLDYRLDQVCSQVLHLDPFPNVETAYSYVRSEAQRHATMRNPTRVHEGSALVSKAPHRLSGPSAGINTNWPTSSSNTSSAQNTKNRECNHYGATNHTGETRFKLRGYP